jgi:hypothetical protein
MKTSNLTALFLNRVAFCTMRMILSQNDNAEFMLSLAFLYLIIVMISIKFGVDGLIQICPVNVVKSERYC